jgi:hypothetical protein
MYEMGDIFGDEVLSIYVSRSAITVHGYMDKGSKNRASVS